MKFCVCVRERERERDREFCDGKRERKMNFCDVVVEIPTQNIQERGERKKLNIVVMELPKLEERGERKN